MAAVIAEPVIGAGGVFPPAPGYLQTVRRLCDEHGAFLILDEVICGFGRLGRWWGAEHYGVTPDLTTFAKAVTSGYQPLGGVLVGRAVRDRLEADPTFLLRHGHTYSGNTRRPASRRSSPSTSPAGKACSTGRRRSASGCRRAACASGRRPDR